MVNSYGLMEGATREIGSMANSMVQVFMLLLRELRSMVNGKKERELGGLIREKKAIDFE